MRHTTMQFGRKAVATAVATALAPALAHGAAAGRVDFAYGDVKGVDTSGKERRLVKGAAVNQGDTIVTARGRAQIRFSDGARTSLLPNTEFRVDTYEYEEKAEEEAKGFFSLLKGGLRTITGAIGKLRRQAYQVTTPSATIGIRGTEYLAVLGNSLNVWVGDGVIEACNNAGCATFEGGESGYVADADTKPISTDEKPDASGGDVGTDTYSSSEDVDESGTPAVLPPFRDGAFYALAVTVGDYPEGAGSATSPIDATFDGGVLLHSYSGGLNGDVGTASAVGATDGIIGWGRWFGGTIQTDAICCSLRTVELSGSQSHHYAIGLPTADMPTSGTGSYALLGGTTPTYADGSGTGTLNSASLNVDFGTYRVQTNVNVSIGGNTFDMNHGGYIYGSNFWGSGYASGAACGSFGCYGYTQGLFAGEGASRAGVVYHMWDPSRESAVEGAAGFTKTGPGTPIPGGV